MTAITANADINNNNDSERKTKTKHGCMHGKALQAGKHMQTHIYVYVDNGEIHEK